MKDENYYQDAQCKNGILAYGEHSGHAHQFDDLSAVEVFKHKEKPYLRVVVNKECNLVHGRARDFKGKEADHDYHQPIHFNPGEFIFGIVEETDWLSKTIRRVVD